MVDNENSQVYTLKDVARSLFRKKEADYGYYLHRVEHWGEPKDLDFEANYEDKFLNFYSERVKEFSEITFSLQIKDELDEIKKSDNFEFTEDDKTFLEGLFGEVGSKGKLDPILRGQPAKAEYSYRIHLYEGFVHIFTNATQDNDLINGLAEKLYNHLDIPVCMQQVIRAETSQQLADMVYKRIHTFNLHMSVLDKYEWLQAFAMDYKNFVKKWDDLFYFMSEVRANEGSDIVCEKAKNISEEENLYAHIQFEYAEEVNDAIAQDEEYQQLEKEYCKMMGIKYEQPVLSKDIRSDKVHEAKLLKRPHVQKIAKRFYEVCELRKKRILEIEQEVYQRHIPDYIIPELSEDEADCEYMSSEDVLKQAIADQKEFWDDEKKLRSRKPVELPDIDFAALEKRRSTFE